MVYNEILTNNIYISSIPLELLHKPCRSSRVYRNSRFKCVGGFGYQGCLG